MESRNPVFRNMGQQPAPSPQQLQDMYNAPAYAPPVQGRTMTIDDVVVKGFLSLGALVVTGTLAWVANVGLGLALIVGLIGLGLGLYMSFSGKANAALVLTFSALYGVLVGTLSHAYNDLYSGVVFQAVVGTALAFAAMLTVYSLKIIRVTPKFVRYVTAAGLALVGLMLINLVVGMFNDTGIGIRENGPIGIVFSLVAILVGCFFLLLDFDMVEQGVRQQAPEKFAWNCAFALTMSLVWIYLELLRFMSILSGDD